MDAKKQRALQSFRRVQGWFAAHPEVMPANTGAPGPTPALATQLDALNGVVTRMTDNVTEQQVQGTQRLLISKDEKALRQDVFAHLRGITKVAQALRGTVPGIGALKMPAVHSQSEPLVHAANAMSKNAAIYQDVLVEHGLPQDFIKQLEGVTTTLRQSIDARGEAVSRRTSATKGIEGELQLGRRIVKVMDASLERLLRSEPATLAGWQQAKRVTLRGGGSQAVHVEVTPASVAAAKPADPRVA